MPRKKVSGYLQEREEMNRLYNAPENRRLKYAAMAVVGVVVILLLSMVILFDDISPETMLIMRGCAGLWAIIFVVLVGLLTYRVDKQHITGRRK